MFVAFTHQKTWCLKKYSPEKKNNNNMSPEKINGWKMYFPIEIVQFKKKEMVV